MDRILNQPDSGEMLWSEEPAVDESPVAGESWPPLGALRIPHPLELQPRRPTRGPRFQPRRDRRDAGQPLPARPQREGWHQPVLTADKNLGAVRINFEYRNPFGTSAGYSEKARRAQYFEGPHEPAHWRLYEVLPFYTDLLFQPLTVFWKTTTGKRASYTLDGGLETQAGELIFEEIKATDAYFDDPETEALLKEVEDALLSQGVRFRRTSGEEAGDPAKWRTIKDIFDDRRTEFFKDDVARVQNIIAKEGGAAPLGLLIEVLGVRSQLAQGMLRAMMVRRHIEIDLTFPPMRDTEVTIPGPPAAPGMLRAFLQRFAVGD